MSSNEKNNGGFALPLTTNESHKSKINYDDLLYQLVDICLEDKVSAERAIADFAKKSLAMKDFKIFLGGSAFTSAANNGIDFLLSKIIKVNYGKNEGLIVGSAFHEATNFTYSFIQKHGKTPNLRKGIKEIIKSVKIDYKFIKPDLRKLHSRKSLTRKAVKLFAVYYEEQVPKNKKIVIVEKFLRLQTPISMFTLREGTEFIEHDRQIAMRNAVKIILAGTPDLLVWGENGELIIIDHKSSATPISGKVEMDEKLSKFKEEIQEIENNLKKIDKQLEKFQNAKTKHEEFKTQLTSKTLEVNDAEANGKPFKALENKRISLEKEVLKWEEHLENHIANSELKISLLAEIDELLIMSNPLQDEYDAEKAEADMIECRNTHSDQLSFYALLFLITEGGNYESLCSPDRVIKLRIENVVKTVNPYLQVFEWEMDSRELNRASELYASTVKLLELLLNGTDPLVLFRRASKSYIGDDSNKLIDEVNKRVYEVERAAKIVNA